MCFSKMADEKLPYSSRMHSTHLIRRIVAAYAYGKSVIRHLFLFQCLLLFFFSHTVFAAPSTDEMTEWWNKNSSERLKFYNQKGIQEVYLTNKEKAYLAPVSLEDRGRNSMFQTAMVIPSKEKVILLEDSIVQNVDKILDLDSDNISEIIAHQSGSGGGSEIGERAIVQLTEDGNILTLRSMDYKNNAGMWGKRSHNYYLKDVEWHFVDLDGDGKKDLKEYRIVHEGRNNRDPIITRDLYRYVFKKGRFIRYLEYNLNPQDNQGGHY